MKHDDTRQFGHKIRMPQKKKKKSAGIQIPGFQNG